MNGARKRNIDDLPSIVVAEELHAKHVLPHFDRSRASNPLVLQPTQVPHLLLGPHSNHLPRVALAVTVSEPMLACNVAVSILEDEDRGLVDLEGEVRREREGVRIRSCRSGRLGRREGVVDIGLKKKFEAR